jgi:hypothetical protein
MLTQLPTPIPIETPKGRAWAIAMIDYGPQWDLQWVSFIHATGECWTFRNQEIRQGQNYTWGLPQPSAIKHRVAKPPMQSGDNIDGEEMGQEYKLMRPKLNGFSGH